MQEREIKQILTSRYDRENFGQWQRLIDFVFPKVSFESSIIQLEDTTNKTAFIHQKGEIQLTDGKKIIILEVGIKKANKIAKTKVGFHNLTAKFIDQANNHGILVFYISEDKNQVDYRLSFICKESKLNEDGSFEEFKTNPKRFTYLLGENETGTTAAKRLKELATKKNTFDFELKDVIDAFSVEKLTDEFFRKYKEQFQVFNNYLIEDAKVRYDIFDIDKNETDAEKTINELPIRDFTKKLLGRLVFLYFLQRKGWMGVPTPESDKEVNVIWKNGYKDFIHKLFTEVAEKEKFHSKFLTELFYNTLNNKDRLNFAFLIDGKSPFKDGKNVSVPYLNGGLFDNDFPKGNSIDFPQHIFSNLFDFLEQYNFTIDENSPEDHEVGIDPEMLGHIFENLLEDNRDKGAYYTPKEVVHYMSQQSIIEYLNHNLNYYSSDVEEFIKANLVSDYIIKEHSKIEKLLKEVKVCDPAIGSGAFPMGVLKVIYTALHNLHNATNPTKKFNEAKTKKDIIQKSIYGVDLESGAVDIARLRFWLALVVDEVEPEPLPNLDYKIMQGHSLLEQFESIPLKFDKAKYQIKVVRDIDLFGNIINPQLDLTEFLQTKEATKEFDITELEDTYFKSSNPQEKKEIKAKIENFEKEFIKEQVDRKVDEFDNAINKLTARNEELKLNDFVNTQNLTTAIQKKLQRLEKELQSSLNKIEELTTQKQNLISSFNLLLENFHKSKPYFLWHLYFMDVFDNGGFDIVIGNPPYIKEYTNRNAFNGIRDSAYYIGKMDIWYYFASMCIDMLKNNGGIQCFIAQSNWITSSGAAKLRNKILQETEMLSFIDFGNYKVFQSAGIQTMIYVVRKTDEPQKKYTTQYARLIADNIDKTFLEYFLQSDVNTIHDDFEKVNFEFVTSSYLDGYITFANDTNENILKKIQAVEHLKLDEKEIATGIQPNPDVVNTRNIKRFTETEITENKIKVGDGVFVITKGKFDKLSEVEKKYIKPVFEPNEVQRYKFIDDSESEIIYITKANYQNDAPNLLKHLSLYSKIMEERRENQNGRLTYYHLQWPRDENFFKEGEKILSVRKCDRPTFIYTKKQSYVMLSFNVIKTERVNLKFLTALLNSKLIAFWLRNKGKMQGNNYQIDKEPLLEIPIVKTDKESILATLVDYILLVLQPRKDQLIKYIDNDLIINAFEDVIDQVIYELYFGNEPEMQELKVLEHLQSIEPITEEFNSTDIETVVKFYHDINEQRNPIRNVLLKANIVSKNLIGIINSNIV